MLHYETIEPVTLGLLKEIQFIEAFSEVRLVGGTALALQIGHRKSIDLDFFGNVPYDTQQIADYLAPLGNIQILQDSKNIHIYLINGIKVDFVHFELPWCHEAITEDNIRLAHLEDIAAMKITAVVGRGTKKDFIDIANLLEVYSLHQILAFYQNKYPNASRFMALKSLLYFNDAEQDVMPVMIKEQSWDCIKKRIIKAVNDL